MEGTPAAPGHLCGASPTPTAPFLSCGPQLEIVTNDQPTPEISIHYFLKGHSVLRVVYSKRLSCRVEF